MTFNELISEMRGRASFDSIRLLIIHAAKLHEEQIADALHYLGDVLSSDNVTNAFMVEFMAMGFDERFKRGIGTPEYLLPHEQNVIMYECDSIFDGWHTTTRAKNLVDRSLFGAWIDAEEMAYLDMNLSRPIGMSNLISNRMSSEIECDQVPESLDNLINIHGLGPSLCDLVGKDLAVQLYRLVVEYQDLVAEDNDPLTVRIDHMQEGTEVRFVHFMSKLLPIAHAIYTERFNRQEKEQEEYELQRARRRAEREAEERRANATADQAR